MKLRLILENVLTPAGSSAYSKAPVRGVRGSPTTTARSIRLNVASKPSGLRNQVMTEDDSNPESTVEVPSARASLMRNSKVQRKVVVDEDTEESDEEGEEEDDDGEDEDDEEEDEEEEEEQEDADGDEEMNDESQDEMDDAEGDMDEDMSDATPAPEPAPTKARATIRLNTASVRKPSPHRVLKAAPKVQSVAEREMQMEGTEDDGSNGAGSEESAEEEDEEEEDGEGEGGVEEEEEEEEEEEDEDEQDLSDQPADPDAIDTIRASTIGDDELDSDSEDGDVSMDGTPDPTKQTRRQRAENESLMALSNEAQKKKFFTQEQVVMRRTEMARRRKDLSEKRNEQEKLDTLDRLLHKRAPVRRTRAQMMADAEREEFGTPARDGEHFVKPKAAFVRTVMNAKGTRVGVPEEWLSKDVGRAFAGAKSQDNALKIVGGSRMVQVVE